MWEKVRGVFPIRLKKRHELFPTPNIYKIKKNFT